MTSDEWLAAHTVKRATTATPDFAFSHTFTTDEGKIYEWGCLCTSLSPGAPKFSSAAVEGEVTTLTTPAEEVSASSVWCGVLLALFAAVFMY